MVNAPVALFVYNRPDHTRRTVEALAANTLAGETPLHVFSDAPKSETARQSVEAVRSYIRTISGFQSVTIVERETNLGLARSIIGGVTSLCETYGRVIVLEDDLVTSPHFLTFMNDGLDAYANNERVQSISGYMYPVELVPASSAFFLNVPHSWGWATWSNRWRMFESDSRALLERIQARGLGRAFNANGPHSYTKMLKDQAAGYNDSWFIRWYAGGFLRRMLTVYPARSLVRNIGIDGTGVHCAEWKINPYDGGLASEPIRIDPLLPTEPVVDLARLNRYYVRIKVSRYLNYFWRKMALLRPKSMV